MTRLALSAAGLDSPSEPGVSAQLGTAVRRLRATRDQGTAGLGARYQYVLTTVFDG